MKTRPLIVAITFACLVPLAASGPAVAQRYSIGQSTSRDESKTPLIILKDDEGAVEVAIAPEKGGELSGVKVRYRDEWIETIYLARDYASRQGWTGKAPLLFPATGRNFPADLVARKEVGEAFQHGAWVFRGQRYEMPIHGFARDQVWQIDRVRAENDHAFATLSLQDSPETLKYFPFGFSIEVTYTLKEALLTIGYQVSASEKNDSPMPFSIGNHITFVSPLVPGSDASTMELVTPSTTELLKTSYGTPTGKSRPRSHADGIQLGGFPRRGAVSLTGYSGEPFIIYRDPQGLAIRMSHTPSEIPDQPVILFNLWGDVDSGFFSPEPWVGLQNSLVLNKGLVQLSPGKVFSWTIRIEFERP